jgi:hypothetical protein
MRWPISGSKESSEEREGGGYRARRLLIGRTWVTIARKLSVSSLRLTQAMSIV